MLVETDLTMAGYRGERVPAMQKRMIDALETIPGVKSVGLGEHVPSGRRRGHPRLCIPIPTTDLRPANAAAQPSMYSVSPGILSTRRARHCCRARDFTWHDDKNAPRVAVVNRSLRARSSARSKRDRRILQAQRWNAHPGGGHCGGRQVLDLTEDPQPAMFLSHPAVAIA